MSQVYGNVGVDQSGTLYLKRSYQRNLLLAEMFIVLAIGFAIGIISVVEALSAEPKPDIDIVRFDPGTITKPPRLVRLEGEVARGELPKLPDLSMIEAGEDSSVTFEFTMATREELSEYNGSFDTGFVNVGVADNTSPGLEEFIPSPDSFIAVDEQPKAIYFPPVRYPQIARKANIEGSVWLKVLLDPEGNVRDVIVALPSQANAGFEEAAMAAAFESKWRPAMQNKQPVMVWVSYEVRFRLR